MSGAKGGTSGGAYGVGHAGVDVECELHGEYLDGEALEEGQPRLVGELGDGGEDDGGHVEQDEDQHHPVDVPAANGHSGRAGEGRQPTPPWEAPTMEASLKRVDLLSHLARARLEALDHPRPDECAES